MPKTKAHYLFAFTLVMSSAAPALAATGLTPTARATFRSLAFHPQEPGTMLVGTDDGLYQVTNIEQKPRWRRIALEGCPVSALLFDAGADETVLYAGTTCCGLYKFTQRRKAWHGQYVPELGITGITSIASDPDNPDHLFTTTAAKVFFSGSLPRTFTALPAVPDDIIVKFVLFDPFYRDYVRLGGFNNVFYRSSDSGQTWEPDPTLETYLHSWNTSTNLVTVAANTMQEDTICWRAVNLLLSSDAIVAMRFHPTDRRRILVASLGRGFTILQRIENRWEARTTSLVAAPIFDVAFQPGSPETVYVAGRQNIYFTKDNGTTWTSLFGSE